MQHKSFTLKNMIGRYEEIKLNNVNVKFKLNTCARINVIMLELVKKFGITNYKVFSY